MTMFEHAALMKETEAAQEASDKDYFNKLTMAGKTGRPNLFTESSSEHLTHIKERINQIVHEESQKLQFLDQLKTEELAASQYQEVITKKNFYFGLDENKKARNLKVHNFNAPGNKYRHPQHILPHEHVHVTHPIDIDSNNKEQLMELYGYYQFLIDLHIAQVRPENLNEKSYVPARFTQRTVMNDANY